MNCYLLAVAEGSSLDAESNNYSLFELVEKVIVAPDAPKEGLVLKLETHCYWEFLPSEVDVPFEIRIVAVRGEDERAGQTFSIRSTKSRMRVRLQGTPVLLEGEVRLRAEWRREGEENWHRDSAWWPLEIGRRTSSAS